MGSNVLVWGSQMHEMSLCLETVKLLDQQAHIKGFRNVTAVWLEVGALSCVDPAALQFCFAFAAKDSVAANAKLHVICQQAIAWCLDCRQDIEIAQRGDSCPHCKGYQLTVAQGDALRIKEIEVE